MANRNYIEQINVMEAAYAHIRKNDAEWETMERAKELFSESRCGGWIDAKYELPQTDDMVLVIASGKPQGNIELVGAYQLASWSPDEGWILDSYPEWEDAKITYWMPLPEPPQEDKP